MAVNPLATRLCLITLAMFSAAHHGVLAASWPNDGKFPYKGGSALLEGAWLSAPNDTDLLISVAYRSQMATQRIYEKDNFNSQYLVVNSHVCLDDNTVRYISTGVAYPEIGDARYCVTAYVNATHALFAIVFNDLFAKDEDLSCPDSPLEDSNLPASSIFVRVDGVMPDAPVLVCKNVSDSRTLPTPVFPDLDLIEIPSNATNYPQPQGPPAGQGIWRYEGTLQIQTGAVYAGFSLKTSADATQSISPFNGIYQTHECLTADTYLATSTLYFYNVNGTTSGSFGCEIGKRTASANASDADTYALAFPPSDIPFQCAEVTAMPAEADEQFALVENLPGNPATVCSAGPAPAPPAGSGAASRGVAALMALAILIATAAV